MRKKILTHFANSDYEGSVIPCKKLIHISKCLYDEEKKRSEFYEYMADELTLVKAYLKMDQLKRARELLIDTGLAFEEFNKNVRVIPISANAKANRK